MSKIFYSTTDPWNCSRSHPFHYQSLAVEWRLMIYSLSSVCLSVCNICWNQACRSSISTEANSPQSDLQADRSLIRSSDTPVFGRRWPKTSKPHSTTRRNNYAAISHCNYQAASKRKRRSGVVRHGALGGCPGSVPHSPRSLGYIYRTIAEAYDNGLARSSLHWRIGGDQWVMAPKRPTKE